MPQQKLYLRARKFGVSLGAMSIALASAGAVMAQDAPAATEVDEIIVTGFRSSLAQALGVKRNEAGAVDVIMAEDIADFPDQNLAEAIQRVPGVAITRDAGEGRNISVRGLGPDFTRIRINGMEALGTTGGTDASGGSNRGRGFDFNVFASDLFSSITVRKTASAETEEGSLGATVDLRASRPFDRPGFNMAVSGQAGWNDLAQNLDPRGAFLISNTWNDQFGILFSIAASSREGLEEGHSTVRWQGGAIDGINAFTPRLPRYGILEHEQDRLGATLSLQWRPSSATDISLDVLYADFSANRFEHFLQAPTFSAGGPAGRGGIDIVESEVDANGNLIYGVFDDVSVRAESRFDALSTEFTQVTLNFSHEFSDSFAVDGIIGTSRSDHDNPIQTTLLFDNVGDGTGTDGYSYDYRQNPNLPTITYGFDVTDPSNYVLNQIRLRPQTVDNGFDTVQLNGRWSINDTFTLRGGVFYKNYTFETTELRRDPVSCGLAPTGNAEGCIPAGIDPTDLGGFSRLVSISDQWDIPGGNTMTWVIPDYHAADALFDFGSFPLSFIPARGNNRSVEEESRGAFLQLDFDSTVGSVPVRGNIGGRYIETDQSSTGYQLVTGAPVFTEASRSYDDFLPAANVVFEVTPDFLIRAGAAEVMTRPGLGNLTPGGTVSVSGANRTVNSGNPELDPTRGTTYDLAFEWYFAPESILSLALFHKELDSFVANDPVTRPFTGNPLGLPDSVAVDACGAEIANGCNAAADWTFNQPVNTDGGDLSGFEISYQQPFVFLPGIWSNFGVLANYTYVDSEIEYPDGPNSTITNTLTNLSKRAYNGTLYYEDSRLSARISGTYRDGYLTNVPGRNGNAIEGVVDTFNVDASAAWTINDNFQLTLEGINLTDEVPTQYVGDYELVSVHHHTGRQIFAGFRYRF